MLALEMAQQLQATGETVDLLILIDTHAPGIQAEPDELTLLGAFCQGLGLSWWKHTGSAVLFKTRTQPEGGALDGQLGWSAWITGALEAQEVPGSHHTMLNDPHVATLAERLAHVLNTLARREAA